MKKLLLVSIAAMSFVACKKVEGEGGRSSISGKIMVHEKLYMNGICTDTVSYEGSQEDVYIVYGDDDNAIDDKLECSFDGSFKFDYLQPGTYTVFAYGREFHTGPNVPNNDDDYYTNTEVSQTVTLGKKETNDLGTINVWK